MITVLAFALLQHVDTLHGHEEWTETQAQVWMLKTCSSVKASFEDCKNLQRILWPASDLFLCVCSHVCLLRLVKGRPFTYSCGRQEHPFANPPSLAIDL